MTTYLDDVRIAHDYGLKKINEITVTLNTIARLNYATHPVRIYELKEFRQTLISEIAKLEHAFNLIKIRGVETDDDVNELMVITYNLYEIIGDSTEIINNI